ncbi:ATG10 enzyme, partial [Acromyrmex charruanus]
MKRDPEEKVHVHKTYTQITHTHTHTHAGVSVSLSLSLSFSLSSSPPPRLARSLAHSRADEEGLLRPAFVASRHEHVASQLERGACCCAILERHGATHHDVVVVVVVVIVSDLIPMDGPGTVTWEEFLENAERFLVVSDKISDGWKLYGDKDIPGQAYLVKRAKCFVPSDTTARKDCSTDDDNDTQELQVRFRQDLHEAVSTSEMPFIIEHHILWSISYSVPVLFFNGWKSDFPGINPVSVNEAQTVHGYKLNYTELSQAIHPIVGTPFLQLHPCLSQGLLRTMSKSKNKLVSWLSCVASTALNLKIHPEYFKLTH